MSESVVQRIVPGAPPPTPLSKSQKKKRKAKKPLESTPESPTIPDPSALVEKAPEPVETREGSAVPEPITQQESQATPALEEELGLKLSPIVELITKRLKATTKKIVSSVDIIHDQLPYQLINSVLGTDICLCSYRS